MSFIGGLASSPATYFAAERQKDVLRAQRGVTKRRTRLEQEQRRRRERKLAGMQIAIGGKEGFELGTGTSLNLLEEIASTSRREGNRISYEGELALANIEKQVDAISSGQVASLISSTAGAIGGLASGLIGSGASDGGTKGLIAEKTAIRGGFTRDPMFSRIA